MTSTHCEEVAVKIIKPQWLVEYETSLLDQNFVTDEEMIAVTLHVAEQTLAESAGGPFSAAVFQRDKKTRVTKLIALGANQVLKLHNSVLHGETTAIMFAEDKLQTHSLHATEDAEYILATSCEPCVMCLGAILWSGVSECLMSATKADAQLVGFDEGPVTPDSYKHLESKGMKLKFKILHERGSAVFETYRAKNPTIY